MLLSKYQSKFREPFSKIEKSQGTPMLETARHAFRKIALVSASKNKGREFGRVPEKQKKL
ncbi:hypothetical protein NC99_46120 [Sunxiuqinia dokdonensis]|uniref:Uncharacterized protein n=1 Tax=Sunxiuqinia dokdonensis TaxID=1409788 RepID=A0A0L8V2W9_9BACT|nr:hypothetical protein NC99_46120 [Sunxiuqinia dokdonensis]